MENCLANDDNNNDNDDVTEVVRVCFQIFRLKACILAQWNKIEMEYGLN